MKNSRRLCARRGSLWLELVVGDACEEAFGYCPLYGFAGPRTWCVGVAGKVGAGCGVEAFILGILHQHGGELFAGDWIVWREGVVADAADDAIGCGPVDGGGVPKLKQ